MDSLKNLGAILSQHYEKIILTVILLALLGTAAFLPPRVAQSRETIRQALEEISRRGRKESQPLDTSLMEVALRRDRLEPQLDLDGSHNLFNPVVWKRGNDGSLYKVVSGDEEGPAGLQVTEIRPLEFRVEFDGVHRSGDNLRYKFLVLDESRGRRGAPARSVYLSEGVTSKNDPFKLAKVNDPAEDPASVDILLPDSAKVETISRENPYSSIAGYEADLVHERLGAKFNNVRTKQPGGIRLGTQSYNIVAITRDAVTLQSNTTGKRWTIRLKGTPEGAR
jgi:hypothetical protein